MKKLLASLVLGLLLSSNAYTASVDDCDGIKSNSTTVKYECVNGDTMTVAAGTLIKKNWVVVTPQKYNAQEVTINNSGTIKNNGTQDANAFLGNGSGTIKINNLTTDSIIQGQLGAMHIGTGDDWTIDNYGKIYGVTQKAIQVKSGDNLKVTNQSGGLIRAGVLNSTTDTEINAILIWGLSSDSSEYSIKENYGTITAARNTVKAGAYSDITTITNYSGGVISNTDDDGEKAAIRIDGNNVTLTNEGTITGSGTSHSIELGGDAAPTGTKIYIDGAPTFTGEIELTNSFTI